MLEQASIDPITEPNLFYSAVRLAAWRGDASRATELIEKMVPNASSRVRASHSPTWGYAKAVLYNGLADYDRATTAAEPVETPTALNTAKSRVRASADR
jgi:hypothetical protein